MNRQQQGFVMREQSFFRAISSAQQQIDSVQRHFFFTALKDIRLSLFNSAHTCLLILIATKQR